MREGRIILEMIKMSLLFFLRRDGGEAGMILIAVEAEQVELRRANIRSM